MAKRSVGLMAFLRGNTDPAAGMPGCANYDRHYGGCLLEDECLVEQGKRCGYFERAVLPTAADIGLTGPVYEQYEKQAGFSFGNTIKRAPDRCCPECGGALKPRHRYCQRCTKNRQRQAARDRQRKKRFVGV